MLSISASIFMYYMLYRFKCMKVHLTANFLRKVAPLAWQLAHGRTEATSMWSE